MSAEINDAPGLDVWTDHGGRVTSTCSKIHPGDSTPSKPPEPSHPPSARHWTTRLHTRMSTTICGIRRWPNGRLFAGCGGIKRLTN